MMIVISFIAGVLLGFTTAALFAANHLHKPDRRSGQKVSFPLRDSKGHSISRDRRTHFDQRQHRITTTH